MGVCIGKGVWFYRAVEYICEVVDMNQNRLPIHTPSFFYEYKQINI